MMLLAVSVAFVIFGIFRHQFLEYLKEDYKYVEELKLYVEALRYARQSLKCRDLVGISPREQSISQPSKMHS
jgi:hypothetical protein